MKTINERIKEFRNQLHLSQEYVANFLGINRATYWQKLMLISSCILAPRTI